MNGVEKKLQETTDEFVKQYLAVHGERLFGTANVICAMTDEERGVFDWLSDINTLSSSGGSGSGVGLYTTVGRKDIDVIVEYYRRVKLRSGLQEKSKRDWEALGEEC